MSLTGTDRGTGTHNTSGTSFNITPPQNFTAGATIAICLAYDNAGSGGSDPFTSVTDSHGNIWTPRVAITYDPGAANAGVSIRILTTDQAFGTVTTGSTVTVTFGSNTTAKGYVFHELTSAAGSRIVVVDSGTGTGSATGTPTVATNTIDNTNMVIGIGGAESADTWAGDGDSSNGTWSTHQHTGVGSGVSGMSITTQRKIVTATATQTYNPTLTSADVILAWVEFAEAPYPLDPLGAAGFFGP